MSLFPAYSQENTVDQSTSEDVKDENTWLSNSSFKGIPIAQKVVIDISSESSTEDETEHLPIPSKSDDTIDVSSSDSVHKDDDVLFIKSKRHKKQKKKSKKHRKEEECTYEKDVKDVYYEDKRKERCNFSIKTFPSGYRPNYNISDKYLGFIPGKKQSKDSFSRYYMNAQKVQKKKSFKTKKERQAIDIVKDEDNKVEEQQTNKVQAFNEKVTKNPNDVETWIQYVNFQNEMTSFATFKSETEKKRLTWEKQLSIVNKALGANPNSLELLQLKLQLMSELLPVDIFTDEVESLLKKDSGNISLWQTLTTAIKSSVALCSVPRVMDSYDRCFKVLRRKLRLDPSICDSHLLGTLYESLIFLRHTGHWEQMWETMKYNLTLNLSISQEDLEIKESIDEKKLIDLEEVILTSGLPLNELWLRIEFLRERCHWISVRAYQMEYFGDPKRYVSPDDVADFVHPVLSKESNFYMGIYFLLSLKVPLLPARHCAIKALNIENLNWSYESLESLLPLIYPQVGETAGCEYRLNLLKGLLDGHLTSGPQCLIFHPAQEPYLETIRTVFRAIAATLPADQRTSICVWWLRFERLLIFLGKEDPLKVDTKGKKIKSIIKDFLKKSENRNNLHFYREYALIELEFGRVESCINILQTAVESIGPSPSRLSNLDDKSALLSVYRALLETYFKCQQNTSIAERILSIVGRLAPELDGKHTMEGVEQYLKNCIEEFLNKEPSSETIDAFFKTNLDCDTVFCYVYVMLIQRRNPDEIIQLLDRCLEHSEKNRVLQEQLYECKIVLLQLCDKTVQICKILKDTVEKALETYKENMYIVSVYMEIQSEIPFWKLNCRKDNPQFWQSIALCLNNRTRIKKLRTLGLIDSANALLNKTLSLYRTLTNTRNIQSSPLVWRLYMFLLREENLCEKLGEEVYHASVTNCPWARSIYIDAAKVAPQKLSQIQDIIREKGLRIHITPEELDILRG